MRLCSFGTYDLYQPRTRVILDGVKQVGGEVLTCHADLWAGTSQKVDLARHPAALLRQLAEARRAYRSLRVQRASLGPCDVVVYPHLGQFDLIASALWFRRRGIPVVWDALISLHDTVVGDRQLVRANSVWAWLLRRLDAWAGRLADCVIADTRQNLDYWQDPGSIPVHKLRVVPVGAEDEFRTCSGPQPLRSRDRGHECLVLWEVHSASRCGDDCEGRLRAEK